jgi:hypothetical protein
MCCLSSKKHEVVDILISLIIFIEYHVTLLGIRKSISAECKADEIDLATFEEAFVKCRTIKPLLW